jgi:AcrR family transcriptional regulator
MAGRPRSFDRDEALETVLRAFWRNGYDGVTVDQLAGEVGVNAPSLYAAFGNKRELFDEAAALYAERLDEALARDLGAPTAREAIARLLHSAAVEFTAEGNPPGCLVMGEPLLAERRAKTREAVLERLRSAQAAGELEGDPEELAALIAIVLAGMADRARDGADRIELERAGELTMRAWPTAA